MDQTARNGGPDDWWGIRVAEWARRRRLKAGETLFRQGERVAALYRLDRGRLRLVRHLEDGTQVVLHVVGAGQSFAEASAFVDAYHCDAVAELPCVVAAIPRAEFLATVAADPVACLSFARVLAAQVRDLRARLELRNIRSARGRLLAWLRVHASGNPPAVAMTQTWTEVAGEIGLTREAVYRAAAALQRDRLIGRKGDIVELMRG